jgi:putative peptide zinc metalloprotease protein
VTSLAILGGALGLVMLVPVPYSTVVEGAVWLPDRSVVHAGQAASWRGSMPTPNSEVREGQVLLTLEDPILLARRRCSRPRCGSSTSCTRRSAPRTWCAPS